MANPWAGEVELNINGKPQVLKLTLGALAELEALLNEDTLVALVERFEGGRYAARDVLALIGAGLRGAGNDMDAETLLTAEIDGGVRAATRAAALLLVRTFSVPEEL